MKADKRVDWIQSAIVAMEAGEEIRHETRRALKRERWKLAGKCAGVIVGLLLLAAGVNVAFSFLA